MSDESLAHLTLRDKLKEAENVTRQLIDHLERGYLPKAHQLRRLSRQGLQADQRESISDSSIREAVLDILQSDEYARQLCEKTDTFLKSITADVDATFNL